MLESEKYYLKKIEQDGQRKDWKIEILNTIIIEVLNGKMTCEQRFEEEGVSYVHTPMGRGNRLCKGAEVAWIVTGMFKAQCI